MKKKLLIMAVTLSLTSAVNAPVWAANTGGTADKPVKGDYAGLVVDGATGDAADQNIEIDTAVTGNVYGGYISAAGNTEGNVNGNTVIVKNVSIGKTLYGGYTKGTGTASGNILRIDSDVSFVYGGRTSGDNANNNKVYITGGTINSAVKGGESGNSNNLNSQANNNEIYITAIDRKIDMVGSNSNNFVNGGKSRLITDGNKIVVGSDDDKYDIDMTKQGIIGGQSKQVTNNQITVGSAKGTNNIALKFAYGGWVTGSVDGCYGSDNTVFIQNANVTINKQVHGAYGAGKFATLKNNSVIIKDGKFSNSCWIAGAYGDGSNTALTGNSVDISGGTFGDDVLVFGGLVLEYSSSAKGDAAVNSNKIRVSGVTMLLGTGAGGIYGGYSKGTGDLEKNEVVIEEAKGETTAINVMISGAVNEKTGTGKLSENKVIINGGTIKAKVYGAFTEGSGAADGNSVTISGGIIEKNIYGAYTETGAVTGNEINIKGNNDTAPTFADDVILYGGFSNNGGRIADNKLNLYTKGISVGDIQNFDTYNFYLPEDMAAGETVLTLKNNDSGLDLSNSTVNIGVLGSAPVLNLDEEITLIHNEQSTIIEGDVIYGKLQQGVSIVYDFETELKNDDHDLVTKVTNIDRGTAGTTDQSKSPVETQTAALGFLNSGSDLLVDKGILDAVRVAAVGEKNNPVFGAANAGKMRYKSGSHADVNGYNIVLGAAKTVSSGTGELTYGPFIEGGWGNYTTYLDSGIRGDGNTKYYGLGLFARQDDKTGIYYEGSVRYGQLEADYASGDMIGVGGSAVFSSYNSSSTYYGIHLGLGKVSRLNETVKADVYAKLLYNHQNGDSVALGGEGNGEVYDFDAVDSMRARIGGRLSKDYGVSTTGYAGLAYEYEFDGEARASVKGFSTPSPSIKGSSGMLELGYIFDQKTSSNVPVVDIGLQGWIGKKQGLTANVNFVWKF